VLETPSNTEYVKLSKPTEVPVYVTVAVKGPVGVTAPTTPRVGRSVTVNVKGPPSESLPVNVISVGTPTATLNACGTDSGVLLVMPLALLKSI
jgi:hypothetical protein